jgi:2-succinyl-5-enolpyruvyl-6-hydroxy-3-cyclohexene-1-carboxylate synthase
LKPDYAIVIGRTTLSRSINNFLILAEKTFVIDPRISTIDTKRTASQVFFALPKLEVSTLNPTWISDWNEISKLASKVIDEDQSWSEQSALRTIAAGVPDGSALFVGSSRPIRDIEAFAKPRAGIEVFANRGLAGIDGNLSTIFGISNNFERTFAVIGDLTFLHDLTALLAPPTNNLTIFIIDNNPSERPDIEVLNHPNITMHTFGKNIYVNPAWNYAVPRAKYDRICLYGDDLIFDLIWFHIISVIQA